jgi:hypothetical protein
MEVVIILLHMIHVSMSQGLKTWKWRNELHVMILRYNSFSRMIPTWLEVFCERFKICGGRIESLWILCGSMCLLFNGPIFCAFYWSSCVWCVLCVSHVGHVFYILFWCSSALCLMCNLWLVSSMELQFWVCCCLLSLLCHVSCFFFMYWCFYAMSFVSSLGHGSYSFCLFFLCSLCVLHGLVF